MAALIRDLNPASQVTTVPDVVGLPVRQAEQVLEAAGFQYRYQDAGLTQLEQRVRAQEPGDGVRVERGATVGLMAETVLPNGEPQRWELPQGSGEFEWFIEVLSPTTHTYTVMIDAPAEADLAVSFETPSGRLNGGNTGDTSCRKIGTRQTCRFEYARLPGTSGAWRAHLTKKSQPPASVEVTVMFEYAGPYRG